MRPRVGSRDSPGRIPAAFVCSAAVPRNRRQTPRDHRVSEVVIAARELFLSQGFNNTPMSRIAQSLGVANAAVYWYFETKDHLLAEVWTRALDEEVQRLASAPEDPFVRLTQGLIHLRPYRQLHMTVHDRMRDSEPVAAVHDRLLGWIRDTVQEGLVYHGRSPAEEQDLIELVVVVFEGSNVPGMQSRTATDLITTVLDRFSLLDGEPAVAAPDPAD